jgi:two-component system sensor histidine kinase KdpD
MKAAVSSLLGSLPPDATPTHELLSIINEECDRLNRLVEEAAEMARLEAGEVTLDLAAVPIKEIVDSALAHCSASLGGRQVDLRIAADIPTVRADRERTREALVQLIDNANLYSAKDQPITITAERMGESVVTSVADRGPGIDDFEQTMIFDKFYRGKDQRYLVRGTGMGLPIAKALIVAQQGAISVTSQLGHGSVFTFTLPVDHSGKDSR